MNAAAGPRLVPGVSEQYPSAHISDSLTVCDSNQRVPAAQIVGHLHLAFELASRGRIAVDPCINQQ